MLTRLENLRSTRDAAYHLTGYNEKQRTEWIRERAVSSMTADGEYQYTINGKEVCQKAFFKTYGFSHKKWKNALEGGHSAAAGHRSLSEKAASLQAWLILWAKHNCDIDPHDGSLHIMKWFQWRTVWEEYVAGNFQCSV